MEGYFGIIRFFQQGGAFMYPIAIVLVIGLAITIERCMFIFKTKRANHQALKQALPLMKKKEVRQLDQLLSTSDAPIAKLLNHTITKLIVQSPRDDVLLTIEENMLDITPRLEKRTNYLATLANVATLLGLLGTIIGLIDAFTAVANADPALKATLLSESISIAMNTTAFGLMVAIPLLLVHTFLMNKTNEVMNQIDAACTKCLNSFSTKTTPSSAKL